MEAKYKFISEGLNIALTIRAREGYMIILLTGSVEKPFSAVSNAIAEMLSKGFSVVLTDGIKMKEFTKAPQKFKIVGEITNLSEIEVDEMITARSRNIMLAQMWCLFHLQDIFEDLPSSFGMPCVDNILRQYARGIKSDAITNLKGIQKVVAFQLAKGLNIKETLTSPVNCKGDTIFRILKKMWKEDPTAAQGSLERVGQLFTNFLSKKEIEILKSIK